jgi:pyruvate dehydrogenase E1 component
MTTSPDVTGTTSLGPWVNRRKLFAREVQKDAFIEHRIPSTAKWNFAPEGQHIELGIAEMNLFLLLGAAGLSHSLWGKRLIPIGTVYDPFVCRGLDALNYACYQDARFMIVGTPSGVTLAPEGGALPRPRCSELRLLPGCSLHDRRHAVRRHTGPRRRGAPVHWNAADRHVTRRAGGL